MSLAAFQTALAMLTASPATCGAIRRSGALPADWDMLTERETARLIAIAKSKGMEANCSLYRANRLAPVVLNCPALCEALGDRLGDLLSDFWLSEPTTNVHFLVEAERFCAFLKTRDDLGEAVEDVLARDHANLAEALTATRAWAGKTAFASSPGNLTSQ